jgi:hypothetical protein
MPRPLCYAGRIGENQVNNATAVRCDHEGFHLGSNTTKIDRRSLNQTVTGYLFSRQVIHAVAMDMASGGVIIGIVAFLTVDTILN